MKKQKSTFKIIHYSLILLLSIFPNIIFSQTDIWFIDGYKLFNRKDSINYYTLTFLERVKDKSFKKENYMISYGDIDSSYSIKLANAIDSRTDTIITHDFGFYEVEINDSTTTVFNNQGGYIDTTVFFIDSETLRIKSIKSNFEFWEYKYSYEKVLKMRYYEGKCYYDEKNKLEKIDEVYLSDNGDTACFIWRLYYTNELLKYYLKFRKSEIDNKEYVICIYLLDYFNGPQIPIRKIDRELRSIIKDWQY